MMARLHLGRRAVATVEFALVTPLMMMFVGGLADFGLELSAKGKLINAVAQGAQYAYLNPTATAASIKNIVQTSSTLSGVKADVTTPAYYCITGTATTPTLTASSAGKVCADGTTAGYFVTIVATYTYAPLMPDWSGLLSTSLSQSVTARMS
jgi:Flp pilus assembly protein TadG